MRTKPIPPSVSNELPALATVALIATPSSPSEDYLTVLAGQRPRQLILPVAPAGPHFANSAVLNYLGKVPDALGWPIDPCFPVQIDFEQVVAGADQRPFAVHLLQSPQQELPESPALLIWPNTGSTVCIRKA